MKRERLLQEFLGAGLLVAVIGVGCGRRDTVTERVNLDGQSVVVKHSELDLGQVRDLFDGDKNSFARTARATTAVFDFTWPSARPVSGVNVTTATMDVGLKVSLYSSGLRPVVFSKEYRNLPPDPTVSLDFQGSHPVRRIRFEITNLNGGDGHIHVREIQFK
jgi:hypothetical protein